MNTTKTIVWDWNGTLLDDVRYSVRLINILLKKYNLLPVTVSEYRKKFTFPVKKYYEALGFDFQKTPFDVIGMEFINLYNQNLKTCRLQPDALETLKSLQQKGYKQVIISAREQNSLLQDIKYYKLTDFFDIILGIDNNFAAGKSYLIDKYVSEYQPNIEETYLIGDTEHDCDIARSFKLKFIRFTKGHQADEHFIYCPIFKEIENLLEVDLYL